MERRTDLVSKVSSNGLKHCQILGIIGNVQVVYPGLAGQGAREAGRVVDKKGDDNFNDFHGKFGDGGRARRRGPRRSASRVIL